LAASRPISISCETEMSVSSRLPVTGFVAQAAKAMATTMGNVRISSGVPRDRSTVHCRRTDNQVGTPLRDGQVAAHALGSRTQDSSLKKGPANHSGLNVPALDYVGKVTSNRSSPWLRRGRPAVRVDWRCWRRTPIPVGDLRIVGVAAASVAILRASNRSRSEPGSGWPRPRRVPVGPSRAGAFLPGEGSISPVHVVVSAAAWSTSTRRADAHP